MNINIDQIGWGKYGGFEGPYYKGAIKYQVPLNPTESQKRLATVCQTEGAAYDAVNMYDRCVISIGLIQWCEADYYLTSKLLGNVCDAIGSDTVLLSLEPALWSSKAEFKKNAKGQWRFFFTDSRGEVNNAQMQRELFLGTMPKDGEDVPNDGKVGSWNDESRSHAKTWAACMANIWIDKAARDVQDTYTAQRLTSFVTVEAKKILWDAYPDTGYVGATRAAFLSYAGNNPKAASDALLGFVSSTTLPKWSPQWCTCLLRDLTYVPNIKIYPGRYTKIKPWLEKLWDGVQLPTVEELKLFY